MSSILKSRERDAIFLLVLMFTQTTFASGQIEKMIHSFTLSTSDGNQPIGALVADNAGNLYGTTYEGGSGIWNVGCGTVFEITPQLGLGLRALLPIAVPLSAYSIGLRFRVNLRHKG